MMVEATVREYLEKTLGVPTYLDIPTEPGKLYIAIERTSGARKNFIKSATLAVQCCSAQSLAKAAALAEKVDDAMTVLPDVTEVYGCHLNSGPYNYTNTQTKVYSYQAVYDLTY